MDATKILKMNETVITNFENIRAMTKQELANFLSKWASKPYPWKLNNNGEVDSWLGDTCRDYDLCNKCVMDNFIEIKDLVRNSSKNCDFVARTINAYDAGNKPYCGGKLLVSLHNYDGKAYVVAIRNVKGEILYYNIVNVFPAVKDNFKWAKQMMDNIPDNVTIDVWDMDSGWFVEHGYYPYEKVANTDRDMKF